MNKRDVIRQIDLLAKCAAARMNDKDSNAYCCGTFEALQFAAATLARSLGVASYVPNRWTEKKEAA